MAHESTNMNFFPNNTDSHCNLKVQDLTNLSLIVSFVKAWPKTLVEGQKIIIDIFREYDEVKNNQQSFNVSRGSNLLKQKVTTTVLSRNAKEFKLYKCC